MCGGSGADTSITAAARVRHRDAAGQQMQLVLDAAGQLPVLDVEIFRIADDRIADMRHVRAQLMGAAGDRLERKPGELLRRRLHHRVIGHGVHGVFLAVLGDAHEGILLDLLLGEISRDAALRRLRHADHQRPIDLARRARAKGLGQRRGGKTRLGHQQAAGGVLVEPMHQARTLRVRCAPQRAQHAVEVAHGAGAALHGKPHRLVEHQHVGIFVKRDRPDEGAVLLRLRRIVARRRRLELERRNAQPARLPAAPWAACACRRPAPRLCG